MRELYEQFIAYSRAYADSVPTYSATESNLGDTGSTISSVLNGICAAITFGTAAARAPLVPAVSAPTHIAPPGDPANPIRFMLTVDPQCTDWNNANDRLSADSAFSAWSKEDPNIPASSWSDQYKAENQMVTPVLKNLTDTYENLARQSSNPVIEDFGVLAAQYGRAFIAGTPTYTQPDSYLFTVLRRGAGVITTACDAAKAN
jgi:hypothetical protein